MKKNHRKWAENYLIEVNQALIDLREHLAQRGVQVPRQERIEQAARKIQRERMRQNEQE